MATLQQILTIATNRGGAVDDLSHALTTATAFSYTDPLGVTRTLDIQMQHIDAAIQRAAALPADVLALTDTNFPALLARELDGDAAQVVRHNTMLGATDLLNFSLLPETAFPSGLGGNEVYLATGVGGTGDPIIAETPKVGDTAFLAETDADHARIWVLMSTGPDVWFEVTASQQETGAARDKHAIMRRSEGLSLSLRASDITIDPDADFITQNADGSLMFNNPRTVQLGDVHDYVTIEARNAAVNVVWQRGDIAIVNGFVASAYTATTIVIPIASNPFLVVGDLISVVGSSNTALNGTFRIDAVQAIAQNVILVMDLTTDMATYIAWPGVATTVAGVLGSITTGNEGTYFYTGVDQTLASATLSADWTAITNTAQSGVASVVGRTGVITARQIAASFSDQRLAFDNQVGTSYGNTEADGTGANQLTITGTDTGGTIEAIDGLTISTAGTFSLQNVDDPLILTATDWNNRVESILDDGFIVSGAAAQIDLTGPGAQVNFGPEAGGLHPFTLEYDITNDRAFIDSNADLSIDAAGNVATLTAATVNINATTGFNFNMVPFAVARLDTVSSHIAAFARTGAGFSAADPAPYTFASNRFDPVPQGVDIGDEFLAGRFEVFLGGLKLIRRITRTLADVWDYEVVGDNIILRFTQANGNNLNDLFDNKEGTIYLEMMRRT